MALLGPFSVGYPIAFRSGGDTTRQAFGKHIQEIERIYGILNALDAGKASSDEIGGSLQAHINSNNPHPNWKPSMSYSDLTGTIDASKVSGKLTNATIDASNVNGLSALIDGQIPDIPAPEDKGDGIIDARLGINGYVKFKNGLIIQWGKTANQYEYVHPSTENEANFGISFVEACWTVIAQVCHDGNGTTLGAMTSVTGISKTGFKYIHEKFSNSSGGGSNPWYLKYLAVGK